MATANSLKNQLAKKEGTGQAPAIANSVKGLMDSPAVKKRFEEVLCERAPQYMSSIVNLACCTIPNELIIRVKPITLITWVNNFSL